ncbi:MAG: flagellar biosynthesis protein FlgN [Spirochaetaceae bacterium]|jgi:hypothetical protein|nr:flagellar biosynthesis protein FlgN [Spirochaetaceae bacterium]
MPEKSQTTSPLRVVQESGKERDTALLTYFRDLLTEQGDDFRSYIAVLDRQKKALEKGGGGELAADIETYTGMEEKIITDIFSVQKSITPLYSSFAAGKPEIQALHGSLLVLKAEAKKRVEENKELLQQRLTFLRGELKHIRTNPFRKKGRTIYGQNAAPLLVDVSG